jgi:predicted TIM-barrel enzyme
VRNVCPLAEPQHAQYILGRVERVDGFDGANSMERLPAETAFTKQVRLYQELTLRPRKSFPRK